MPRNGTANLIPLNQRTKEQQKEIARRGGIASGESRKKRKTFKEQFLIMLENDPNLQQELIQAHLDRCKKKGEKSSAAGNAAFMNLLEIIGEAPIEEKKVGIEIEDLKPLASLLTITEEEKKQYESND